MSARVTTGYSGTPLLKKLGVRPGARMLLHEAPAGFLALLGDLPEGALLSARGRGELDFVMLFARSAGTLAPEFTRVTRRLAADGMLWVAWPKKAARVETDLDFTIVQRIGLDAGLVDTKICAVDETWSALKFVRRVVDRPGVRARR